MLTTATSPAGLAAAHGSVAFVQATPSLRNGSGVGGAEEWAENPKHKPKALDLFCCAGGASMGIHRAGFDVVGVDIEPQPHYPFEFRQGDALAADLSGYDFIWASPPCRDHSNVSGRNRKAKAAKGTGWMLEATLARLMPLQVPWIVENVETAKWPPGVFRVLLCGSMFGLDVRRHRWFASNTAMLVPSCEHGRQVPRFRSLDSRRPGILASVVGVHGHTNYAGEFAIRCQAMGIDWMSNAELSQAIPPAFSEYLARAIRVGGGGAERQGRKSPPTGKQLNS